MPSSWTDSEAIAAGLYDPPGSVGAINLKNATDKLKTGASDLYNNSLELLPSTKSETGATRLNMSTGVPSVFKDPVGAVKSALGGLTGSGDAALKDAVTGKITGTVAGVPISLDASTGIGSSVTDYLSGINTGLENWIVRIVIMLLGFVFVAVGLAMFGINNPIGRGVIAGVGDSIRDNAP